MSEQKSTKEVSVIIPHLRGEEYLLKMLDDLAHEREDFPDLEVILVDNASSDGSVQLASEKHPWITVLSLDVNQGYAGGCNRGIEASSGKWVWLVNDDVRIKRGALQQLLSIAESADDLASVQPKILSVQNPDKFDYAGGAGGFIDRFGYPFALGRIGGTMEDDHGQYDQSREIFWASGTACLWRRACLDEIGLLDERFFAHMEEIDLAWRAWNAGWRILSAPMSVIHHFGGGTLSYQAWRKMYLNHRNNLIMIAKNSDRRTLITVLSARLFLDLGIGLMETVSGRPGRLGAVIAGWYAFIRETPYWLKRRKYLRWLRKRSFSDFHHIIYNGSILFAYGRGVRKASALEMDTVSS